MAIRPVDLQLAYLAAPQNAAQVNSAQQAPTAAQAAAQNAFVSQLAQREESVAETAHAEGTKIRTSPDGGGNAGGYTPQERRRQHAPDEAPIDFAGGDDQHFIDVTA